MRLDEIKGGGGARRTLLFDSGETLDCPASVAAELSLYSGMELDEDEYLALKRELARLAARQKAAELLGARDMSRGELIEKLLQKGFDPDSAEDSAQWLTELGVIDDAKYAALLARHYASKGYGKNRVRDELYRHRLPREYWDEALEELPEPSDTLDRLLAARLQDEAPSPKDLKRATDALRRRGFTWDEISAALHRRSFS